MRTILIAVIAAGSLSLVATGCGPSTPSCTDSCSAGATKCSGSQVQTCSLGANTCLGWMPATNCASGQQCDPSVNKCVGTCDVKDIHDACTVAASHFTDCCGGGNIPGATDPQTAFSYQCNSNNSTPDQKNTCSEFATKDCASIHSMLTDSDLTPGMGFCCCPSGQFCDPENGNSCVPTCQTNADCSSTPNTPACAPVVAGDTVLGVKICKPDDGAAWHGCNGLGVTCVNGYDCFTDANGDSDCLRDCSSDAACANTGIACCNTNVTCNNAVASCGAAGGCTSCQ